MKKIVTLVLALVLSLSMGAVALATDSPSIDNSGDNTTPVQSIEAGYENYSEAQKTVLNAYVSASGAEKNTAAKELINAAFKQVGNADAVIGSENFFYNAVDVPDNGTSEVKLKVPSYTGRDGYRYFYNVLHLKADGTWENLEIVDSKNGVITVKMSSFSPVIVVVKEIKKDTSSAPAPNPAPAPAPEQTPEQAPANEAQPQSSGAKSPKTSDSSSVMMALLFVAALSGAAWYGKKSFVK